MAVSITIRTLVPGDNALLREMSAVMGEAFGESAGYAAAPPADAYLERLLGDGCFIALAALEDATVVGGIVAYELRKYERERSEIYLYDLAVAESHRRLGIATALIGRLREIARERGAWVIFVQADLGDDPAIELYAKLGTREDVVHFDIAPD